LLPFCCQSSLLELATLKITDVARSCAPRIAIAIAIYRTVGAAAIRVVPWQKVHEEKS